MKTIQEIKAIIAKKQGYESWDNLMFNNEYQPIVVEHYMELVAAEMCIQFCERQRELCAEAAYGTVIFNKADKEPILNATLATES